VHYCCAPAGTPISGGLQDLAGLLSCLGAQPWAGDARWWRAAIERPLACGNPAGLAALLDVARPARGGVLWRSAKADVLHEMGLPGQQQHSTLLRLSAIERHWYTRCAVVLRSTAELYTLTAPLFTCDNQDWVD
jgi:E3 ubiquitin-protein ligase SHPRH